MTILQSLSDGLSLAAILVIVALGLAITFGVMQVINLAHGELIMIGAYTTYVVTTTLNLPFGVSIILAFIVTGMIGALMEITVIKKLYGRPLDTLLATFGFSILFQQIIRIIFGPGGQSVDTPLQGTLNFGELLIPNYRVFVLVFSICLLGAIAIMIYKTKYGMKLRTISENREMSECLGINTSRIDTLTFALGSGLAGVAGAILAPLKSVSPTMGAEFLIDSFMVVVLGGVGSISGTALGAFIIGESNILLASVTTETLAKIVIFILIIILIRFKPEGLFKTMRR